LLQRRDHGELHVSLARTNDIGKGTTTLQSLAPVRAPV